jgi:hypothetical protein
MFLPPFDSWAAGKTGSVRRVKDCKQRFLFQLIYGIPGIGVDGGKAEVLAGTLSPMGSSLKFTLCD